MDGLCPALNIFQEIRNYIMTVTRKRIASIDILRGIVMIIMALDHTRDFFHADAMLYDPTDLSATNAPVFLTRWVTHFCAPVFVFLSGMSAFLYGRKITRRELSLYLLKRGIFLLLVEIVVMSFLLSFNPFYNIIFLEVIWAIGISMILLSALVWLPLRWLLALGLLIFLGHNLLDYFTGPEAKQAPAGWLMLLHGRAAFFQLSASHMILVGYSFLPWTGIMILGYCCGTIFQPTYSPAFRKALLVRVGLTLVLFFVVLRAMNGYGNPQAWTAQKTGLFSALSFINCNKYPPSLMFACMTLGPALIALAMLERWQGRWADRLRTYGNVPLFYFVLHFLLIHLLCVAAFFASGHSFSEAYGSESAFGFRPRIFGYSLSVVYAIWIAVVLVMYPLCRWFGGYKNTHRQWWVRYL